MATKNDTTLFASPWNDSDIVLVVEDQELHVHKWILKSLSPVFKAMLEGHFQEASQDKITLKEKDFKSMVQFLEILYPPSMFEKARAPLDDESRLSIMALADEYQCVNLVKRCIDEARITPENVLQVLPCAVNYHQTELPKVYDVIKWGAPTAKLEKVLPEMESNTMLLTKCRFLESAVVKMQDAIISLIGDFLKQKQRTGNFTRVLTYTAHSRCSHNVGVREIKRTKSCIHCKGEYKEKFLVPIPSCQNTQDVFSMLQSGDDVATAVKDWEIRCMMLNQSQN